MIGPRFTSPDFPNLFERATIEQRAKLRRDKLACDDAEPHCSEEDMEACASAFEQMYVLPQGDEGACHCRMIDGELVHCTLRMEEIEPKDVLHVPLHLTPEEKSVHLELQRKLASHYVLTAFGWDGTVACKLAILDEMRVEASCRVCRERWEGDETNGEGQTC